jgi:hypothetical protein
MSTPNTPNTPNTPDTPNTPNTPDTPNTSDPSYSFSKSVDSINEGGSFTITFTTNQSGFFPYTITGVSSADINNRPLGGYVSNGSEITFSVVADNLTEGVELFTISLDNGLAATSVVIVDTSKTPGTLPELMYTSSPNLEQMMTIWRSLPGVSNLEVSFPTADQLKQITDTDDQTDYYLNVLRRFTFDLTRNGVTRSGFELLVPREYLYNIDPNVSPSAYENISKMFFYNHKSFSEGGLILTNGFQARPIYGGYKINNIPDSNITGNLRVLIDTIKNSDSRFSEVRAHKISNAEMINFYGEDGVAIVVNANLANDPLTYSEFNMFSKLEIDNQTGYNTIVNDFKNKINNQIGRRDSVVTDPSGLP